MPVRRRTTNFEGDIAGAEPARSGYQAVVTGRNLAEVESPVLTRQSALHKLMRVSGEETQASSGFLVRPDTAIRALPSDLPGDSFDDKRVYVTTIPNLEFLGVHAGLDLTYRRHVGSQNG